MASRRMAWLCSLVLVASACAGTTAADGAGTGASPDQVDAPVDAVATATPVPVVAVLSGRDAIADAQGAPHILWFWGAH